MKSLTIPTPAQLMQEMDKSVIGQVKAKRALSVSVSRLMNKARFAKNPTIVSQFGANPNLVLIGPSGSGKTLLAKTAARLAGIPCCTVDCTHLVRPGREGLQLEQCLAQLIQNPTDVVPTLAVVILDEIDKLAATGENPDGALLQRALLTALNGAEISVIVGGRKLVLDTSAFLFVGTGAFAGLGGSKSLEKVVQSRVDKHSAMGFGTAGPASSPSTSTEWLHYLETEDLVKYGFQQEFAARLPVREVLHGLTENDLAHILSDSSTESPILKARAEARILYRVNLEVTRGAIELIAHNAFERGDGARALAGEWEKIQQRIYLVLPFLLERKVGKLIIDNATVNGGDPQEVKCRPLSATRTDASNPNPDEDAGDEEELSRLFPKGSLPTRPPQVEGALLGGAHWATREDLEPWFKPAEGGTNTATPWPGITPIVETPSGALRPILRKTLHLPNPPETNRNMLVVGKPGSGKTTRVLLPLLCEDLRDPNRSVVIIDAQLELTPYVLRMVRKHRGPAASVIYFNPTDPACSAAWNPLQYAKTESEIREIIKTIVSATPRGAKDTPHFELEASNQLRYIVQSLIVTGSDQLNFPYIFSLLESGVSALMRLATAANCAPLAEFAGQLTGPNANSNAQTTRSTMTNLLECWSDENVAATTQKSEFQFEALDEKPTVMIFATPEEKIKVTTALRQCFIMDFFRFVMQRVRRFGTKPPTIPLYVDEFASAVGRLTDLELRINTLRKRGLSLFGAVQHLSQVSTVYDTASESILAGFSNKIFIPALHDKDVDYVVDRGNRMTTEIATSLHLPAEPRAVPVIPPETAAGLPKHPTLGPRMTVFLGDCPPFQMFARPVYESGEDDVFGANAPKVAPPPRPTPLVWHKPPFAQLAAAQTTTLPPGITDARGWTDEQIQARLDKLKMDKLDWNSTTGSARKWWEAFENENRHRLALVLRLVEELANRNATVTEFFLAYVYSNTDNIQANLYYLDYSRLKKEEQLRKQEAQKKQLEQERKEQAGPSRGHGSGGEAE